MWGAQQVEKVSPREGDITPREGDITQGIMDLNACLSNH